MLSIHFGKESCYLLNEPNDLSLLVQFYCAQTKQQDSHESEPQPKVPAPYSVLAERRDALGTVLQQILQSEKAYSQVFAFSKFLYNKHFSRRQKILITKNLCQYLQRHDKLLHFSDLQLNVSETSRESTVQSEDTEAEELARLQDTLHKMNQEYELLLQEHRKRLSAAARARQQDGQQDGDELPPFKRSQEVDDLLKINDEILLDAEQLAYIIWPVIPEQCLISKAQQRRFDWLPTRLIPRTNFYSSSDSISDLTRPDNAASSSRTPKLGAGQTVAKDRVRHTQFAHE